MLSDESGTKSQQQVTNDFFHSLAKDHHHHHYHHSDDLLLITRDATHVLKKAATRKDAATGDLTTLALLDGVVAALPLENSSRDVLPLLLASPDVRYAITRMPAAVFDDALFVRDRSDSTFLKPLPNLVEAIDVNTSAVVSSSTVLCRVFLNLARREPVQPSFSVLRLVISECTRLIRLPKEKLADEPTVRRCLRFRVVTSGIGDPPRRVTSQITRRNASVIARRGASAIVSRARRGFTGDAYIAADTDVAGDEGDRDASQLTAAASELEGDGVTEALFWLELPAVDSRGKATTLGVPGSPRRIQPRIVIFLDSPSFEAAVTADEVGDDDPRTLRETSRALHSASAAVQATCSMCEALLPTAIALWKSHSVKSNDSANAGIAAAVVEMRPIIELRQRRGLDVEDTDVYSPPSATTKREDRGDAERVKRVATFDNFLSESSATRVVVGAGLGLSVIADSFCAKAAVTSIDLADKGVNLVAVGRNFAMASSLTSLDMSQWVNVARLGSCFALDCKMLNYVYMGPSAANRAEIDSPAPLWRITVLPRCFLRGAAVTSVDFSGLSSCALLQGEVLASCPNLEIVKFGPRNAALQRIGFDFAASSGLEATIDLADLTSLHTIEMGFCRDCRRLQRVVFPPVSSCRLLGLKDRFVASSGLRSISLSNLAGSLTTIEDEVFMKCRDLRCVDLSPLSSLRSIGHRFCYQCTSLDDVRFVTDPDRPVPPHSTCPQQLVSIGSEFGVATTITRIDLVGLTALVSIGSNFCADCTELLQVRLVDLPAFTTIGGCFLIGARALAEVRILDLPSLSTIDETGFLAGVEMLDRDRTILDGVHKYGPAAAARRGAAHAAASIADVEHVQQTWRRLHELFQGALRAAEDARRNSVSLDQKMFSRFS